MSDSSTEPSARHIEVFFTYLKNDRINVNLPQPHEEGTWSSNCAEEDWKLKRSLTPTQIALIVAEPGLQIPSPSLAGFCFFFFNHSPAAHLLGIWGRFRKFSSFSLSYLVFIKSL